MRAFKRVPYLTHAELEPEFICNLSSKFRICVYSRLERIPVRRLWMLDRGICSRRGRVALVGSCFGDDFILTSPSLRDLSDAIALTFVQVT